MVALTKVKAMSVGALALLGLSFLSVKPKRPTYNNGNILPVVTPKPPVNKTIEEALEAIRVEFDSTPGNLTQGRQDVLTKGFPENWNPCTLGGILDGKDPDKRKEVQMVVMGGSPSARAANNCTVPGQTKGRYSDILQAALNNQFGEQSGLQFEISNMAHGDTDSVFTALLMDSWVDPTTADILLWEFSINDLFDKKTGAYLDFFLQRVGSLFLSVGKQPPPLVLLYLWDYGAKGKSAEAMRQNGVGTGALYPGQWAMIQKYTKKFHWNIQVIQGEQLISNMILHAIYKDMALCKSASTPVALPQALPSLAKSTKSVSPLQKILSKKGTRLKSYAVAQPNAGTSTLHLTASTATQNALVNAGKASETREDRLLTYQVPGCNSKTKNATQHLTFTLKEPGLQWLAFGFGVSASRPTKGRPVIKINQVTVSMQTQGKDLSPVTSARWVRQWIPVNQIVPPALQYNVSLCGVGPEVQIDLRFVVAITGGSEDK